MGIISKIFAWGQHPSIETQAEPIDWVAFLALVIIASFLWTRVLKQVVEGV